MYLQKAAAETNNLVIFLLGILGAFSWPLPLGFRLYSTGFYTTNVIGRWWEARVALLKVEDAVITIASLTSTYVRNSDTQNTKKMLTNYALLVRALMTKQLAQLGAGGTGSIDCADLMSQEIMVWPRTRCF